MTLHVGIALKVSIILLPTAKVSKRQKTQLILMVPSKGITNPETTLANAIGVILGRKPDEFVIGKREILGQIILPSVYSRHLSSCCSYTVE